MGIMSLTQLLGKSLLLFLPALLDGTQDCRNVKTNPVPFDRSVRMIEDDIVPDVQHRKLSDCCVLSAGAWGLVCILPHNLTWSLKEQVNRSLRD